MKAGKRLWVFVTMSCVASEDQVEGGEQNKRSRNVQAVVRTESIH